MLKLRILALLLLLLALPAHAQVGAVAVTEFGAACDGTTDDAAAINAAIVRARGGNAPGRAGFRLVFPAGRTCRIDSSLDLTGIATQFQATIDGSGATLDCRSAGAPCIDMMGSRFLALRDLTIAGHATATPSYGVQYGRTRPDRVADLQEFSRVVMTGRFTRANLYNRAAETSRHIGLRLLGAAPYSLVLDGVNHFAVGSAFIPVDFPRDTPTSFNEPLFIQADLRNADPAGSAIWMAGVARPTFIASYIGQRGPVAVVLWTGAGAIAAVDANIHIETDAVQTAFLIVGGGPTVYGLRYTDFSSWAQRSIFALGSDIPHAHLLNLTLELGLRNKSARVFDQPSRYSASGSVHLFDRDAWNAAPGRFQGMACLALACTQYGQRVETAP